jgi:C-terminal processing protease CtpA/Prc
LKDKGCDKFIFDVRGNPGGDLNSIVAVLSYFLNEGDTIISIYDKSGVGSTITAKPVTYLSQSYQDCNVKREEIGMYRNLNFAVLCDEDTASAAEFSRRLYAIMGLERLSARKPSEREACRQSEVLPNTVFPVR